MNPWPFPDSIKGARVMVFVDGENLSIRYGKMLADAKPVSHVVYEPSVFVWSEVLSMAHHTTCEITRCHYYTSVAGDEAKKSDVHDQLAKLGIQAPRVFHKNKTRGSKQVDISLAVEMLNHGFRKNYDAAVLVAGDEDYVPLVKSVVDAGSRVFLWFLEDGLSPLLRRSVDHYFDLKKILFNENAKSYYSP